MLVTLSGKTVSPRCRQTEHCGRQGDYPAVHCGRRGDHQAMHCGRQGDYSAVHCGRRGDHPAVAELERDSRTIGCGRRFLRRPHAIIHLYIVIAISNASIPGFYPLYKDGADVRAWFFAARRFPTLPVDFRCAAIVADKISLSPGREYASIANLVQ